MKAPSEICSTTTAHIAEHTLLEVTLNDKILSNTTTLEVKNAKMGKIRIQPQYTTADLNAVYSGNSFTIDAEGGADFVNGIDVIFLI